MSIFDIRVKFPGGRRVEAAINGHHIVTDQSLAHGGDGSAPEPFELFLASIATCAGSYVVGFCQARGIPIDWIELVQRHQLDDTGRLSRVELELSLPRNFPENYRAALVRAIEGCKVKKTLANAPEVVASVVATAGGDDLDALTDT